MVNNVSVRMVVVLILLGNRMLLILPLYILLLLLRLRRPRTSQLTHRPLRTPTLENISVDGANEVIKRSAALKY